MLAFYSNYHEVNVIRSPRWFPGLEHYGERADFVFHLAGVNRPVDPDEFMRGNLWCK